MSTKKTKKSLALFIVAIILTVLSIATIGIATVITDHNKWGNAYTIVEDMGIKWGWNTADEGGTPVIAKLAYDVYHNGSKFMGITNPAQFIGMRYDYKSYNGVDPVAYPTGMCVYHRASTGNETRYVVTNVIDINIAEAGKVVVYGGTNTNGSSKVTLNDTGWANAMARAILLGINDPTTNYQSQGHQVVSYAYTHYFYNNISPYMNTTFQTDVHVKSSQTSETGVTATNRAAVDAASTKAASASSDELKVESKNANITYDENNNAYVGPIKITCGETNTKFKLENLTVTDTKTNTTLNNVTIGTMNAEGTFKEQSKDSIISGKDNYYIKIGGAKPTKIKINMSTTTNTTSYYRARILVCLTPAGHDTQNQNALIYTADEVTGKNTSAEITIERKTINVSLQKQDADGKDLAIAGITFDVYSGNTKKGTLTTDSKGKTNEIELPVGTYTLVETSNTAYGYKQRALTTATFEIKADDLASQRKVIAVKNTQKLGSLEIRKVDVENTSLKLKDVSFVIGIDNKFIQLTNKNGKVATVTGTATVAKNGVASNSEYGVNYVDNQNDATTFVTGKDGIIHVNNLEVYKSPTEKYEYAIKETANADEYYEVLTNSIKANLNEGTTTYINNQTGTTTAANLTNRMKYVDLSGYVWLDEIQGKDSSRDGVYTQTDKRVSGIKVSLVDKNGKDIVQPTTTDENGNYKFTKINRDMLSNYNIVFEYNGLIYTSVTPDLSVEKTNTSKSAEVYGNTDTAKTRANLNSKYTEISKATKVEDNTITASTNSAGFDLSKGKVEGREIKNINLGIQTREQPDVSISDDVENVMLRLNGYQYIYRYGSEETAEQKLAREASAQNVRVDANVKVKLRKKLATKASDIQALKDNVAKLEAYVTYGVTIGNQSQTLETVVKQINNYYDISKLDTNAQIVIGDKIDDRGNVTTEGVAMKVSNIGKVVDNPEMGELTIRFDKNIVLSPGKTKTIYVQFKLNDQTIIGLLNKDTGVYNIATIASYESYYGGNTYEGSKPANGSNKGKIYAGLDKDSIPNNETIKFVTDDAGNVKYFDMNARETTADKGIPDIDDNALKSLGTFGKDIVEDDASSAPTLVLQASHERAISGTVFEDNTTVKDNMRLGNGQLDNGENKVSGVTVELIDVATGEVAKLSNNEDARTVTAEDGTYRFGRFDQKYIGVLPGKYVIRFTYKDGTTKIANNDMKVLDYKSTVVTSGKVKDGLNNNDTKWYADGSVKNGNYSVAVDDFAQVEALNKEVINNETVNKQRQMQANTPVMDIGIEFETLDNLEAQIFTYNSENGGEIKSHVFVDCLDNMNFGLAEKPHVNVETSKQVVYFEYKNAKGETLFYGDPRSNKPIQYVKHHDNIVEAEIDQDLIQGSTLNLTYNMNIKNTSELDYTTRDFYYFGTKGTEAQKSKLNITKVVDYMSDKLVLNADRTNAQGEVWKATSKDDVEFTKLIDSSIVNINGYQVLMSQTYGQIANGDTKTTTSYATVVTNADDTQYLNCIEILEYTGGKRIQNTTPGNYNPNEYQNVEKDSANINMIINAPTGRDINYTPYIVTGIITLIIVAAGVVIIRKRLVK